MRPSKIFLLYVDDAAEDLLDPDSSLECFFMKGMPFNLAQTLSPRFLSSNGSFMSFVSDARLFSMVFRSILWYLDCEGETLWGRLLTGTLCLLLLSCILCFHSSYFKTSQRETTPPWSPSLSRVARGRRLNGIWYVHLEQVLRFDSSCCPDPSQTFFHAKKGNENKNKCTSIESETRESSTSW